MDAEFPNRRSAARSHEIMQFAPSRFDEEIAYKQPHEQLSDPFLLVKQTKNFFNSFPDLHCLLSPFGTISADQGRPYLVLRAPAGEVTDFDVLGPCELYLHS
jgi:hypothetical protein